MAILLFEGKKEKDEERFYLESLDYTHDGYVVSIKQYMIMLCYQLPFRSDLTTK